MCYHKQFSVSRLWIILVKYFFFNKPITINFHKRQTTVSKLSCASFTFVNDERSCYWSKLSILQNLQPPNYNKRFSKHVPVTGKTLAMSAVLREHDPSFMYSLLDMCARILSESIVTNKWQQLNARVPMF